MTSNFHYGYFLRAAAAIGRYDRAWLNSYLPLFEQLRKDVANYDRNDTSYPFLRNFSPFYGHNWANGTSQNGADQESTSESINFAGGLMELGLLLGNNEWRDMGMYMYEQEIQAAEQYWFNQDATLGNIVPRPPRDPNDVRYNGNWPEQFVTFRGPDNGVWHTTLAGILHQRFVNRETFFGGVDDDLLHPPNPDERQYALLSAGTRRGFRRHGSNIFWTSARREIPISRASTRTS